MPKRLPILWEVLFFINDSASDFELEPSGSSLISVVSCKFPKSKEAASVRKVLLCTQFTVYSSSFAFFFYIFGLYRVMLCSSYL